MDTIGVGGACVRFRFPARVAARRIACGGLLDRLDWEYDKGTVLLKLALYAAAYGGLTIAAGYLLHVGWALYEPAGAAGTLQ
jgi:hypothetical protein